MNALKRVLVTGIVALATIAVSTPAHAHPGNMQTSVDTVIQGEGYWIADAACDPDFDGEHTSVQTSGNTFAFLPHSTCGVTYGPMYFSHLSRLGCVYAVTYSISYEAQINVYVDGALVGTGTNHGVWECSNLTPNGLVLPGYHTVRIDYVVTSGASYANMNLDFVTLTPII